MTEASVEDEDEFEDEESPEEEPAKEAEPLPRARRVTPRAEPSSMFGKVPVNADAWGIVQRTELGAWDKKTHPSADGRLLEQEFLPADLSRETVERRWGAGHYKVSWYGPGKAGGRKFICYGREFTVLAPPVVEAAQPIPDDPVMAGLERAFRLQAILDGRAQQQLQTMATLIGLNGRAGPDPEVAALRAEMTRMREQAADERVASLQRELAQLRSELVDEPEPGAVQQAVGAVAKAGARRAFSNRPIGESLQGAFSTWVAEDPVGAAGQLLEVAAKIPSALEAIAKLVGRGGDAPPAHAPPAQLAPAAPPPPARVVTAPPPPSPSSFGAPTPRLSPEQKRRAIEAQEERPRAVRIAAPVNGATAPAPISTVAPTEPPPVTP